MTATKATRREAPRKTPGPDSGPARRPLALGACFAGLISAGGVLAALMALALVGWFAADQGSHGTTTDALRIGADAWLLAQGSGLDLGVATITMMPLGLTALCMLVSFRLGRWAGATSSGAGWRRLGIAGGALAVSYAAVAVAVAILSATASARPGLPGAFLGSLLVALAAGLPGLAAGTGQLSVALARLPDGALTTAYLAGIAVLSSVAAGGILVATAFVADFGAATRVLGELDAGAAGAAFLALVLAGFAPNAALFGASYLTGPGFAVGTGTVVSSGGVVLGPLPALPLVAALPSEGPPPSWAPALLCVPALLGLVAGAAALRSFPAPGYAVAGLRGLGGGFLGGLLLGACMWLSAGAVGPGRMAEVGPAFLAPTGRAMLTLGLAGAVGALLAHWRRRPVPDDAAGDDPEVDDPDPDDERTVRLGVR